MDSPDTDSAEPAAFVNTPIDADGLPHVHEQAFAPLDPTYARMRAVSAALSAGIIVTLAVVAAAALSSKLPLIIGALAVIIVGMIGVAQRVETNHMGYLVREHDVSFCSGVIGRSVATAPFARVQHVSIERGPLDRRFGLAGLQLRTAGGHLAIPGLRHDVAERLKELVADRAGALADAETDDESPPDLDAA